MGLQDLYAENTASGNVTTPANAYGAADGVFTTDSGAKSWTHRWQMQNPTNNEDQGKSTHTITARVRSSNTAAPPTVNTIYVRQSGVILVQQNVAVSVTSGTGQDISFTFAGELVTNGTAVTIELVTTFGTGPSNARGAVQLDSIKWSGEFTILSAEFFQFL